MNFTNNLHRSDNVQINPQVRGRILRFKNKNIPKSPHLQAGNLRAAGANHSDCVSGPEDDRECSFPYVIDGVNLGTTFIRKSHLLHGISDDSYDLVISSHSLEHIPVVLSQPTCSTHSL